VLDRVTVPDILDARAPAIQQLLRRGALGLMNTTSSEGRTAPGSYVTLSSGVVALPPEEYGECFGGREPYEGGTAAEVFLRRTGCRVSPGAVLQLGLAPLLRENLDHLTGATPGALGDLLSRLGPTGVLGNSDGDPEEPPTRFAPNLIARSSGVVDHGDLSEALTAHKADAPFGRAQDPRALLEAYRRLAPRCASLVVDLGETTRAELYRPYLPKSLWRVHRLRALARADGLVAALLREIDLRRTEVVLVCPFPALSDMGRVANLGLLALPCAPKGFLASSTTRTPGLVANVDFLPTLAGRLGLRPLTGRSAPLLTGAPAEPLPWRDPLAEAAHVDRMVTTNRGIAAGGLLTGTAAVLAFLGALATLLCWVRRCRPSKPLVLLVRCLLLSLVVFPVALAVVAGLGPETTARYYSLLLPLWIVPTLLISILPGRLPEGVAFSLTALFVATDLLRGGHLLGSSILADYAIVGTRFHGMGNEYEGIYVGASLVVALLAWERFGPPNSARDPAQGGRRGAFALLALWFAACVLVVGWPTLGDDAGGIPTAVFGFGVAWGLLRGKPVTARHLIGLLVLSLGAMVLLSMVDSLNAHPTHIGRTAQLARQFGPSYVFLMAARKLGMNWGLVADPRALGAYAGIALLGWIGWSHAHRQPDNPLAVRPMLRVVLLSGLWSAAASFAFNDTGVVGAALVLANVVVVLACAVLTLLPAAAPSRSVAATGPTSG
jgi:hypothetical protein